MRNCYLHSQKVESIFQLLGEKENDITFSLGWVMSKSPALFNFFLHEVMISDNHITGQENIFLQEHQKNHGGFTDIEIKGDNFHLIIEAKRGWALPSTDQIQKYCCRFSKETKQNHVVTVSECTKTYFDNFFQKPVVPFQVTHIPWARFHSLSKMAIPFESNFEKRLLQEFIKYLEKIMTIQNLETNWVYVVSIANKIQEGYSISWRDIVEKRKKYFHPVAGGGWPTIPPNYIAFRYDGKLQSIHHIESFVVSQDLSKEVEGLPSTDWDPHFVYSLGPAIKPTHEVKTGNIYPSGRVWCMLDTLLTSQSISEARDISQNRIQRNQENTNNC